MATQSIHADLIPSLLAGGRDLRPAQVRMASLVTRAIDEDVPAILEAPTGTGKTGGYLVPALRSGKTILVSTATKALQDQIFLQDVPFLIKHLMPFGATVIKGVGNYICRDRLTSLRQDPGIFDTYPALGQIIERVDDGRTAFSGEFDALDFSVPGDLRLRVNGDRDVCAWNKCDHFDNCYIRTMRDRAKSAQLIIVNHKLLLLDAASDGNILPASDVLIVDEAHHLADEATSAFTVSFRATQLASLLQLRVVKELTPENLYNEIGQLSLQLWHQVEQTPFGQATKVPFREAMGNAIPLAKKLTDLAAALRQKRPSKLNEKEAALFDKLVQRVQNLATNVQLVFVPKDDEKYVHYVERVLAGPQHTPKFQVCAAPLDVAPFLKEQLFDRWSCVVMTSATLATIGPHPVRPAENGKPNFAFFRKQIGLSYADYPGVIEEILPPTFDYRARSLLYVPRGIPEPVYGNTPQVDEYVRSIAEEMQRLVTASRGRAFLLFSSRRMLDEVYRRIANHLLKDLSLPVLSQTSDVSRPELLRSFREREGAVLFGLKSFWEGVDIAGEALSLVVIDKLPFGQPDDPVHAAKVELMKANNENWFGGYVLSQVVLNLKQGVGRLLRTPEDRGVMAILDTRLLTKGYGRDVLNALPPAKRCHQLAEVERFFA